MHRGKTLLGLGTALCLILFVNPGLYAESQTFTGFVDTLLDDNGNLIEAALEIKGLEKTACYSIVLDAKLKDALKDLQGKEIQIEGKLITKDSEKWIAVDQYFHVVVGLVKCKKSAKGDLEAITISCRNPGEVCVEIDKTTKQLGSELDGKLVRAVGSLKTKGKEKLLAVRQYARFIEGKGYIEVESDDDGEVIAVMFNLETDDEVFSIPLDSTGKYIADNFEFENIKITGIITKSKGKQWLTLLTCVIDDEDGEDDEEEIEDEEEWDDEEL